MKANLYEQNGHCNNKTNTGCMTCSKKRLDILLVLWTLIKTLICVDRFDHCSANLILENIDENKWVVVVQSNFDNFLITTVNTSHHELIHTRIYNNKFEALQGQLLCGNVLKSILKGLKYKQT